ncbi:hypothetical protein POTOM_046534 [Populus tomentosa]|uniref:Uncharacterized protein n=1 Tax=Populus tomentosa TaxID=118781 RepID=A0A8X8CE16_POPTO|nr:hypothetical protein POTOM_046534 [Populus tomentosa]
MSSSLIFTDSSTASRPFPLAPFTSFNSPLFLRHVRHLVERVLCNSNVFASFAARINRVVKRPRGYGVEIEGKRAFVTGRSNIVGMPAALLLQAIHFPARASVDSNKSLSLLLSSYMWVYLSFSKLVVLTFSRLVEGRCYFELSKEDTQLPMIRLASQGPAWWWLELPFSLRAELVSVPGAVFLLDYFDDKNHEQRMDTVLLAKHGWIVKDSIIWKASAEKKGSD